MLQDKELTTFQYILLVFDKPVKAWCPIKQKNYIDFFYSKGLFQFEEPGPFSMLE
jgi:hypothetical protein